jgi:hypothetical protein
MGDRGLMYNVRHTSTALYEHARHPAAELGNIIAATMFVLVSSPGAVVVLGDVVNPPAASRFGPPDD